MEGVIDQVDEAAATDFFMDMTDFKPILCHWEVSKLPLSRSLCIELTATEQLWKGEAETLGEWGDIVFRDENTHRKYLIVFCESFRLAGEHSFVLLASS